VVVTRMEGTAVPAGRRYIHPLPDVSGTVHVSTSRSGDNCSIGGSGDSRPGPARQWFIQRVIPMAGHMRCVVPSDPATAAFLFRAKVARAWRNGAIDRGGSRRACDEGNL
jgi:hypothetical protein